MYILQRRILQGYIQKNLRRLQLQQRRFQERRMQPFRTMPMQTQHHRQNMQPLRKFRPKFPKRMHRKLSGNVPSSSRDVR